MGYWFVAERVPFGPTDADKPRTRIVSVRKFRTEDEARAACAFLQLTGTGPMTIRAGYNGTPIDRYTVHWRRVG